MRPDHVSHGALFWAVLEPVLVSVTRLQRTLLILLLPSIAIDIYIPSLNYLDIMASLSDGHQIRSLLHILLIPSALQAPNK